MTIDPQFASPRADTGPALLPQLRAAAGFLEMIAADMSLLDSLPVDERRRLQQAVAGVYHPDPALRRQRLKAAELSLIHISEPTRPY